MSRTQVSVDIHPTSHNKSDRSSDFSGELISPGEAIAHDLERAGSAVASDEEWVVTDCDIQPDDSASRSRHTIRHKAVRRASRTKSQIKSRAASQHSIPRAPSHRGRHHSTTTAGSVVFAPEVPDAPQDYGHYPHAAPVYSRATSVMSHYQDPAGVHPNPFASQPNPDAMVPYNHQSYNYPRAPMPPAPGYYHPGQHQQRMTSPYGGPQDAAMYPHPNHQQHNPQAGYPFPAQQFYPQQQFFPIMAAPGAFPANTPSTSTPKEKTPSPAPAPAPAAPAEPSPQAAELALLKLQYDKLKADIEARDAQAQKAAAEAKIAAEKAELETKLKEEMTKALEKQEKEAKEKTEELEKRLGKEKEAAIEVAVKEAGKPKVEAKAPIKFKDAVGRKFTLPYDLISSWDGMEQMIQQAFVHVAEIGPRVEHGQYDLMCDGQIILPMIWDQMIKPDASIEMKMWPPPAGPPGPMLPPGMLPPGAFPPGHGGIPIPPLFGAGPHLPPGVEMIHPGGHHGHHGPADKKKKSSGTKAAPKKGTGFLSSFLPQPAPVVAKKGTKKSAKK